MHVHVVATGAVGKVEDASHIGDNLISVPRESRQKVATEWRKSRQNGASRDKKARVTTKRRESRQKGASRNKRARLDQNRLTKIFCLIL